MDPLALGCVLLAAVFHAAWNIILKAAGDPLRTATVGMVVGSIAALGVAAVGWLVAGPPAIPPAAWALGVVSGGVEVLYFVFLAAAYSRGDLSVVYPLARGSAPVLAVVIGVGVLGEELAPGAVVGVGLLIAGLILVQRPWRLVRNTVPADDRQAAGFALLTGATIATYTAIDRVGVQLAPAWIYAAILFPSGALGLVAVVALRTRVSSQPLAVAVAPGPEAVGDPPLDRRRAVASGALMFGTYALVLVALSRAALAVVAPLRESAVVLASAWGVVRLGEARDRADVAWRLAGSVLVVGGGAALAIAR